MSIAPHDVSSKHRPLLRRLGYLVSKFIRPTQRIRQITPPPKSEHQSIDQNEAQSLMDEIHESFSVNGLQKPRQHSFDYHIYMKCFIHELRTPVSTINMGLHLLKQTTHDADNQQTIKDLQKSTKFIESILTKFATVQDGNIELNEFEPFNFHKLITTVEVLILYNFKESDVKFSFLIEPEVMLWNYGDAHNIKHVLINLLKNAIKYRNIARDNTLTVRIGRVSCTMEAQVVRIYVRDTNDHLLPHIKEHLFETFNSTSGSGMGLYICKTIVELHDGTIHHHFIEPHGNEFVIQINFRMCHNTLLHLHTPSSHHPSIKVTLPMNTPVYNVLLVDDSFLNRKITFKVLKTMPIFGKIYTAEDGADALNKMDKYKEHDNIVLLDKNMPVMNGWEAVERMRKTLYDNLVIGLTGEESEYEIQGFMDRGADYVIVKPLDKHKLELISRFLIKYGIKRSPGKTIQLVNDQLEWV
jgi:signal transduction histidine kinase/CheY-like chemotaxis protein